jgi:DNA-binding response OmpR family regulator
MPPPAKRILLIDDDALFRHSLTVFIASLGYDVVAAETGRHGLSALEREPFDLMVADCQLPDLSGMEVVRLMRERGITIPVLLVSAALDPAAEAGGPEEKIPVLAKTSAQLQLLQPTISTLLERPRKPFR